MRKKLPKQDPLNDGFLIYGHRVVKRNEQRKRIGTEFKPVEILAFSIVNARESDYDTVNASGYSLDLKLRTWYPPNFNQIKKTNLVCKIDDVEFDVIRSESDKDRRYLYWYLQEVGGSE